MEQAVIREYKEETGLDIANPCYRGVINVVFSKGTYRYHTFLIDTFYGEMKETEEHIPMLINIDEVFKNDKRFACIVMLEPSFLRILLDRTQTFELTIHTSEEEVINKIYFEIKDIGTSENKSHNYGVMRTLHFLISRV